MSTFNDTISMLEAMPEEARESVCKYTQHLFTSYKPANPFVPLTEERLLNDLEISRRQAQDGKVRSMHEALMEMGKKHGFA